MREDGRTTPLRGSVPGEDATVVFRLRAWVARKRISHMKHGPADDVEALISTSVELAAALAPLVVGPRVVGPLTQRGREAVEMALARGLITTPTGTSQ